MVSGFDIPLRRRLMLRTGRIVATLGDAVALIGELPEFPQLRPAWQRASEAIGQAAKTCDPVDVESATTELVQALAADNLLRLAPPGGDGDRRKP